MVPLSRKGHRTPLAKSSANALTWISLGVLDKLTRSRQAVVLAKASQPAAR
jgi:hypothetical protein